MNFVVFRENTEGVYVGVGGRFKAGTDDEVAIQEEINTWKGVQPDRPPRLRVRRRARADAGVHGRQEQRDGSRGTRCGSACSRRWPPSIPAIPATHIYIDALAMFLVKDPGQFQVIVTNNLFGDIVTDIGGALQGGLGMAASGNIHPGRTSLFEPVHGSAPPLAGKNVANPMGAILSAALMLETLGRTAEATAIERAVEAAVPPGRPPPTSAARSAPQVGDIIAAAVARAH